MFDGQDKPKGAKKSLDTKEGLARRQQQSITIRKDKREALLEKKRRAGGDTENQEARVAGSMDPLAYDQSTNPALVPPQLLPQFAEMVVSNNPDYVFHGTLMVRKLLSIESNPPIDAVIATGVVPYFVNFMSYDEYPKLQFEAAWALTNIASGTAEHTHLIIESQAVPHFIRLLNSPDEDCREQATWAIGNLAGEGSKCRDYVLSLGVMGPLLTLITSPSNKITVQRNAVWALSNLCRSKPPPDLDAVSISLPVLASLLNHSDDEVVVDAAWAISYISDGKPERVQAVLDAGVLSRVIQLLSAPTTAMQTPAIRTIGNIATGNDRQTQAIINGGALPPLHFLLQHTKRSIRKEACWTVSNICAGQINQVDAVVQANLIPQIIRCTQAQELEVKKEATWVIANVCSVGSSEHIQYVVDVGAIGPLCDLLQIFDPKIVSVALEALQSILDSGATRMLTENLEFNPYSRIIHEYGGVDHLEKLQTHTNHDVYQLAMTILETYFETEEVAQTGLTGQQSGFAFQAPAAGAGNFAF